MSFIRSSYFAKETKLCNISDSEIDGNFTMCYSKSPKTVTIIVNMHQQLLLMCHKKYSMTSKKQKIVIKTFHGSIFLCTHKHTSQNLGIEISCYTKNIACLSCKQDYNKKSPRGIRHRPCSLSPQGAKYITAMYT